MSTTNLSETDMTPALVVSGVSHSFVDTKVLNDVSLTVDQGAFVMLLGLNGAGKSTLFSLITRLYDNVSVQISIRGFDVRRRPSQALQRLGRDLERKTVGVRDFAGAGYFRVRPLARHMAERDQAVFGIGCKDRRQGGVERGERRCGWTA